MFLPIQFKPDTSEPTPEKFIFVVERHISSDMCQEMKNYLDNNSATHRRGSKTPEICNAQFSTCLIPEPNKPIYHILQNLLIDYNSRHQFKFTFMEPFEIKRYEVDDKFTLHNDNYLGTSYGLDRKINIIVQLSDTQDYEGGELTIGYPTFFEVPKTQGTVVIFPSNYLHSVTTITHGARYSLIGHVWGPEFK